MRSIRIKSYIYILLCCLTHNAYADYVGRLPSNITMQGGTQSIQNAIANCQSTWQCTFNCGVNSFSYSTMGNTQSSLTLNATLPPNPVSQRTNTPFYVNNASLNPHSKLILNGFDSLLLDNTMYLNNASLEFNTNISGSSFEIDSSASLILANNSSVDIRVGGGNTGFINLGNVSVDNSTLSITATDIKQEHNMTITNSTLSVNGSFYNVGQTPSYKSSVSTLINNGGTININGNFHNGGMIPGFNDCRIGNCGGGNLINYGGNITITGNFISKEEDGIKSSVQIYGGSIKANRLENQAGSTLIFGTYNGKIGKFDGTINNAGNIKVNITGADFGSFTLYNGLSGINNVEVISNGSDFVNYTLTNGTITLNKNTNAVNSFISTLDSNDRGILNALESQNIWTYGDGDYLRQLSKEVNNTLQNEIYDAAMLNLYGSIQSTILPLRFLDKQKSSFSIAPIGSKLKSQTLSSSLYGVSMSANASYYNHYFSAFGAYGFGNANQESKHSPSSFETQSFLLGFMDSINLKKSELTLLGYFGGSQNSSKRTLNLNSNSFNASSFYSEVGLQGFISIPYKMRNLSFKPFGGLEYTLGIQNGFSESSAISNAPTLSARSFNTNTLALSIGAKIQYDFNKEYMLFGGIQATKSIIKIQNIQASFGDSTLNFKQQDVLGYTFLLGGLIPLYKNFVFSPQVLYAKSINGFNISSAMLNLSYKF